MNQTKSLQHELRVPRYSPNDNESATKLYTVNYLTHFGTDLAVTSKILPSIWFIFGRRRSGAILARDHWMSLSLGNVLLDLCGWILASGVDVVVDKAL